MAGGRLEEVDGDQSKRKTWGWKERRGRANGGERETEREREGEAESERPGFVSGWVEGGGTGFHGRLITNGRVSRSSAADSQELELHRRRSIASHPASQAARQPNGLTGREPGRPRTLLCLPTYQPNPLPSSRFLAHNPLRQRSPPIDLSVLPAERLREREGREREGEKHRSGDLCEMDGLDADITSRRISHLREYVEVYI